MTQTSTAAAQTTCYYCKGIATAIKQDVTLESPADADRADEEIVQLLPICEACDTEWYDGTEMFPALLPLA